MPRLPLEGTRVIDATMFWSGAYLTNLLASLGSEVIKVESIQRVDGWRGAGSRSAASPEKFWERSPFFNHANTNKLGITLDLSRPKGAEIFKRLVKIGDIVAENYTPRVMKGFGLDYDVLKTINPTIIMISLPAYGATGPWKDHVGFAFSLDPMAGTTNLMGWPDGLPRTDPSGFSDSTAGVNGAAAVLIAMLYRQITGKGQYINLSQVEALTCLIGETIIDYTMNGRVQSRRGNRHPSMAPHGCYRCKGDDLWATIAVSSDQEWESFCRAIGSPPWTKEERFAGGSLGRWQNQDELDKLIEEWTIQHDHYIVMNTLQGAEVAAGAVFTTAELLTDPHLKYRGTFQMVDRAIAGCHPYIIPSAAERLSKSPTTIRRPAPLLGQHNEYVLGELLGISKEEIQHLADERIIGTEPLGV